jgi:hypothetical protein
MVVGKNIGAAPGSHHRHAQSFRYSDQLVSCACRSNTATGEDQWPLGCRQQVDHRLHRLWVGRSRAGRSVVGRFIGRRQIEHVLRQGQQHGTRPAVVHGSQPRANDGCCASRIVDL